MSVQFSHSVMSDSLGTHGLQHSRPPCPSPTPRVYSSSRPLSQRCHPTILSSVVPFSSHLQSFPASGSFLMSRLLMSGGQSIGVSASTSVLPMNIQDRFPFEWTGWSSTESNQIHPDKFKKKMLSVKIRMEMPKNRGNSVLQMETRQKTITVFLKKKKRVCSKYH